MMSGMTRSGHGMRGHRPRPKVDALTRRPAAGLCQNADWSDLRPTGSKEEGAA